MDQSCSPPGSQVGEKGEGESGWEERERGPDTRYTISGNVPKLTPHPNNASNDEFINELIH